MSSFPRKAVILARGLGTRMRRVSADVSLTKEQEQIARDGIKALIPVANGKTLLDMIVNNVVEAGFSDICLVIGPEHDIIREYCSAQRLAVSFAIQDKALGTADAVLAAEEFAAEELFLVLNSDNLYGVEGLRRLRETNRQAILAFERQALIAKSNISEDRIAKFATVQIDEPGNLIRIAEKPETVPSDSFVSMNAWLFSPAIFTACRAIGLSKRNEYEITAAVQYAVDELGEKFTAVKTNEGVLDLSVRADIANVGRFLDNM